MLRITLRHFRCWDNTIIEAPVGQITLICGSSGGGKSTLLHAITHCLFGNLRMVTPNNMDHADTRVTIEFPYILDTVPGIMTIDRQRGKGRFVITHNERRFEDRVAQALIEELFGKYDIWLASCYIGQGCRNSFLTSPNTGKMEFLNSIAFHEENPAEYIERLDQVVTSTDADYKAKNSLYESNSQVFTRNNEALTQLIASTDMTRYLTPEQITYVHTTITTKQQELVALQTQKNKRDSDLAVLNNLQQQWATANKAQNSLVIVEPAQTLLSYCAKYGVILDENSVQQLADIIPLLQRRDDLQADIRKYNNNGAATANYTMSDYSEALAKENSHRDNQRLSQTLGTTYDATSVSQIIAKHRTLLNAQERIKVEVNYEALQRKLAALTSPSWPPLVIPEIIPQTIMVPDYASYSTSSHNQELAELSSKHGALQVQIQHLQKGHDVLQCPSCKTNLRNQSGGLVIADSAPINMPELQVAINELSTVKSRMIVVQQTITRLMTEENTARASYERSVTMERKRIDAVKEQIKHSELEQQRRAALTAEYERQAAVIREEIDRVSQVLKTIPEVTGDKKLLSPTEIERLHGIIAQLSNMVFVDLPAVSSAIIRTVLEQQEIAQRRIVATEALQQHTERIPELYRGESVLSLQGIIRDIRNYQQQSRQAVEERTRLSKLCDSLQQQIAAKEVAIDPSETIKAINTELEGWQQTLTLAAKANAVIEQRNVLMKDQEHILQQYGTLTAIGEELADLYNMRQIAVETECKALQDIVDSVNVCIDSVCSTLFDEISITLSLFKTMKTTGNVKPVVNFNISYKGGSFDSINQMSGGEGDRASLALTLALNRLSSCPILMLDESLASLDLTMKEKAIRTIRENTNSTVLLIMHDSVEGHFDNVVNVDELRETSHSTA